MNFPRFPLSTALTVVAVLAINLGVIRALHDGPEGDLLLIALPTANMLAAVGFAGLRRRRLRTFAAGFVAAGTASLLGFLAWESDHPWTFLVYVQRFCDAIEALVSPGFPAWTMAATYAALIVAFLVPHAIVGSVSGGLIARGWAIASRPRRT